MENKQAIDIDLSTSITMTLVFLLLKCVGVIEWSWWLVFSPIYIAIGLFIIAIAVFSIGNLISYIAASFHGRGGGGDAA